MLDPTLPSSSSTGRCRLQWVQGAVVSSAVAAAAIGAALGGVLSDRIGGHLHVLSGQHALEPSCALEPS